MWLVGHRCPTSLSKEKVGSESLALLKPASEKLRAAFQEPLRRRDSEAPAALRACVRLAGLGLAAAPLAGGGLGVPRLPGPAADRDA